MNELEFRTWLSQQSLKTKVQCDCISRLKKIEREINYCELDEEYHKDKCEYLLSLFANMGRNTEMSKYHNANFPIGKYSMNTYRLALNKYIKFCKETQN